MDLLWQEGLDRIWKATNVIHLENVAESDATVCFQLCSFHSLTLADIFY